MKPADPCPSSLAAALPPLSARSLSLSSTCWHIVEWCPTQLSAWAGQHESSTVCDLPWGACYLRSHDLACYLHLQDFSTSSTPTALDFHGDNTWFGLVNAVLLTCSWAPMILKASALCYHHSKLLTINLLPMDLWGPFLLQQGKKCLSLMCFTLCWGAR